MSRILVVDDEMFTRRLLCKFLARHGFETVQAESGEEALQILCSESFDLMLSDIFMQPMDGLELLNTVRETSPAMSVIMLTASETLDTAVESMKKGAFDYLLKPVEIDELIQTVRRALEHQTTCKEHIDLQAQLEYQDHAKALPEIVSRNFEMLQVCNSIKRIAPSDIQVLIYGEKGSGKQVVGHAIHQHSPLKHKPFSVIDCTNVSVPFEPNPGGTIFLDEVNTLSIDIQTHLIGFLKNDMHLKKEEACSNYSTRIIAASCEKLEPLVEQGRFLKELYQLFNIVSINIPPLRNRPEDILLLVGQTLRRKLGVDAQLPMIDREVKQILEDYSWPGNVQELEETILHAFTSMQNGMITKKALPEKIVAAMEGDVRSAAKAVHRDPFFGRSVNKLLHAKKTELLKIINNPPNGSRRLEFGNPPKARKPNEDDRDIWGTFKD